MGSREREDRTCVYRVGKEAGESAACASQERQEGVAVSGNRENSEESAAFGKQKGSGGRKTENFVDYRSC